MQLSANLNQLYKRLENTIVRLESDELIQQMRNDSSLYACKMKYIQEIIEEEISSCSQLEQSLILIESLQEKLRDRELAIEKMKNQYAVELQNIEHHCRELILENDKKLKEKDDHLQRIKNQFSSLQANLSRSESNNKAARQEVSRLKYENSNLKQDRTELENIRSQLELQIQNLQRENSEKHKSSEGALKESFQVRLNQVINEYQETIQQMQKDMGFIKQSWERVCVQLQGKHQEELALRAIEAEEKFKKELAQYADNLKMGSSVVFSDSQDVISKKIELVERRYKTEISKLAEEIKQLQEQMSQVKEEIQHKEQSIAQLSHNLKEKQIEHQRIIRSLEIEIDTKEKEIARLNSEATRQQRDMNQAKFQIQKEESQIKQLKQQLVSLKKVYGQTTVKLAHQEQQLEQGNRILASQTAKIEEYMGIIATYKQSIAQKENAINLNATQLTNLKNNLQKIKQTNRNQRQVIDQLNQKAKREKEKRKIAQERVDKFHIIIRKLSKQLKMLKEEVSCAIQVLNNKLTSQFSLLTDHIAQHNESLMRKHKSQMSQLLDEMEEKEKELAENLAAEKDQLRLDIKEYEQIIKERDNNIYKLKQYVSDLEQEKKEILMDLETQKIQSIRLEERMQANEQSYVNQITKAQKEISRCMSGFSSHWSQQIGRVLQELQVKDAKIKLLSDTVEHMTAQGQQGKRQRVWMEDEIRKYKKKYENFKQERDEKVELLLKKLQQENKHRINLEKQLKQVRMTIMKGTYQSNNNFSFNDKERESTNKPFTTSTKEDQHRERQKELSQIKEMIAKTYNVVDGAPERDLGRNFSKKTLF